ncbi:hypothetical protein BX666DRAFT_1990681 [Dichotomocladium elegans]|nr:hypothetical protein BX666DRAFT_1990681 [Dichotomocladium elegans]
MAATSYIDMMNDTSVFYSVNGENKPTSAETYPTQDAIYPVPSSTTTPTLYSDLQYMPLDAMAPAAMLQQQQQQQQQQQAYKLSHVPTVNNIGAAVAPVVVKSQGNSYYLPVSSSAPMAAQPSPSAYQYMVSDHLQSAAVLNYASAQPAPLEMAPATVSAFPVMLPFANSFMDTMMFRDHPSSPIAVRAPSVPSQQAPPTQTRRGLPRRHTVSAPNKPADAPNAKLRKALKAKRHRSLGKLEDATFDKWIPPADNAASSPSSMLSSPVLVDAMSLVDSHHSDIDDDEADDDESMMDDKKPQQCLWVDCYQELPSLEALVSHVKELHIGSGKPLYYCAWKDCPRQQKPFSKRHKMHNHLRTHTGERPFECTEPGCGKRFSRPDSLTTHSKIHSNIRPYICPYPECGKAYYHLRSLRKHERTHETSSPLNPPHHQDGHTTHASVPLIGDAATLRDWCGTPAPPTSF